MAPSNTGPKHAEWQAEGKDKRQSSLCVYELQDGLVRRVWYYPAVRSNEPAAAPAAVWMTVNDLLATNRSSAYRRNS